MPNPAHRTPISLSSLGLVAALSACSGSPEHPATPEPGATASASASAAPAAAAPPAVEKNDMARGETDAPRPAQTAAPGDSGAAQAGPRTARSADTLTKLPKGGAMYFAFRVAEIAQTSGSLGDELRAGLAEISRALGGAEPDKALAAMGLDTSGSVVGAVLSPSEKSARAVVDAMIKGTKGPALAKLEEKHMSDAIQARLLVPLKQGADVGKVAGSLAKILIGDRGVAEGCPGAKACAAFGAEAPLSWGRNNDYALAVYADGSDLRIDLWAPIYGSPDEAGGTAGLVALRALKGGSGARCALLDPNATLSVCVDGPVAGELGTTTGYAKVVGALAGEGLDPKQRIAIAKVGQAEAAQNLAFAAPSRKIATDGTFNAHLAGPHPDGVISWALADAARPSIEKAFSTERCAAGQAIVADLLPALTKAVGDPGKDFSDEKKTYEHFKEAGWGAWPVLLSGTWLNLLPLTASLQTKMRAPVPAALQACLRAQNGRLDLSVRATP
ncbi:MAG: hypothetical protein U0359_34020 [Byssovorax sp.]